MGLVVNYSSVGSGLELTLDMVLRAGVRPEVIFVPEHGLFGLAGGEEVPELPYRTRGFEFPVVSLHNLTPDKVETVKRYFEKLDVVVYDIQDVGLRYYTFIYALAEVVKLVAELGKKLIVLDRPNPLGRALFGPRISDDLTSDVGGYWLPLRYGLTPGELALYYRKALGLEVDIEVVPCTGWRGELFPKTGLPWNMPSPNLPTFNSLLCYAGMCLFEATNVSVGRGTTRPFEFFGAPWIDNDDLVSFLRSRFPKLKVRKREFVPMFAEYTRQICRGIEFFPSLEDNFFEIAVELYKYLRKYGEFSYDARRLDELAGARGFASDPDKLLDFNLADYVSFIEDILLYA